jgi:NADPH-dependent curcumin reductase CurA
MTTTARQVRLATRPVGMTDSSTWKLTDADLPALTEGDVLVRVTHLSLDPAMRGWLNDVRSYIPPVGVGEVMRAAGVGTVEESRHPDHQPGDVVAGTLGVTSHAVIAGDDLSAVDTAVAPAETWLGALGMPGLTAYFGLFDVCRPQPGETILVSGAAGAVGSIVGQLAKAHGCRVVGIAGGEEKCRWLTDVLGFDAALDYRGEVPLSRALAAAAPKGIDMYFDNVGGEILDLALRRLRRKGRIAICGAIASYNATEPPPGPAHYMSLLVNRASMEGFLVFDYADRYPEAVADLSARLANGSLVARETVVEGGIEDFGTTFNLLFSGGNTGKLVLKLA